MITSVFSLQSLKEEHTFHGLTDLISIAAVNTNFNKDCFKYILKRRLLQTIKKKELKKIKLWTDCRK